MPNIKTYEKHGRWLDVICEGPAGPWNATCSNCNIRNDIPHPYIANYCPNCGAKMDKEAEQHDK